jgi:hypothetical protein
VSRPEAIAADSETALKAHQSEGPKPTKQVNAWVETFNEIREKVFDLTANNPHLNREQEIPKPWEITASLIERVRELNSILESLHKQFSNGEEE